MQTGLAHNFTHLYNSYYPKIHRQAQRLTDNSMIAEDLVQDTFLKLWMNREKMHDILDIEGWLFIVMRRKVVDRSRRVRQEVLYKKYLSIKSDKGFIPSIIEFNETNNVIRASINKLPRQQKLVYQLIRERGWTLKQVSAELNLTESTVKTHLRFALKNLRKKVTINLELSDRIRA